MAWVYLVCAGLLEIVWAVGLKHTDGFTRLWPSVGTVIAMIGSFALLGLALRSLPLGTAYAIWTGIGAIGTVAFGIFMLGEDASFARIVCVVLIATGIVGLKLVTPST
jgi:quaternary ammonium compound-resistance protein SugE